MAATDFSAQFADRFESTLAEQNQPATDTVNARLQRIEELERRRQERIASNPPANTNDAASRLQRRDRLIRQSTQSRSMERRSFASNIQRTPVVRSQTLDTHIPNNDDNLSFREVFESTRQHLFGPRASASSENLSTFHRSASDNRLVRAPVVSVPQESDSGSSTPRSNARPSWDIATGLAEAFSSVRSSLLRPEVSLSAVDVSRSPATARETRNTTTNMQRFMMSSQTSSPLTRSSSVREARRETRFRRRTIEGVDSNVTRALERERVLERERSERASSSSRSNSVTRTQSFNRTQSARTQLRQTLSQEGTTAAEVSVTETATESTSYSGYTRSKRSVDLFPDDSVPILGLEDEKVKFIDPEGHCYWLSKHHQLLRLIKTTKTLPEIKKVKLQSSDSTETNGYIASLEGNADDRYGKLRELVSIARKQEAIQTNGGDEVDSEHRLSLLELYQRGDFLDEKQNEDTDDIDEKYKNYSLYTPPRKRPDLESYLSSRTVLPLYHGIEQTTEKQEKPEEERVVLVPRRPVQYQLSVTRMTGRQFASSSTSVSNGGLSVMSQRIAEARQQNTAMSASSDGQSITYQSSEQAAYSQEVTHMYDNEYNNNEIDNDDNDGLIDNANDNSEVNLVMERLQMMQEATGQEIDPNHLDYEEMLMIQKALEENPSPPETPEQMMSPGAHQDMFEYEHFPENNELIEVPETRSAPLLSRMNSDPVTAVTNQSVRQNQTRSITRSVSSDGRQSSEHTTSSSTSRTMTSNVRSMNSLNNSVQTVNTQSEVFMESTTSQSVIDSEQLRTGSVNQSESNSSNSSDSFRGSAYPSRVSMSPRLQRISSSGSDTMLPMPSMDFSPLNRSPQKFNFQDVNSPETINEVTSLPSTSNCETISENMPPTGRPDLRTELSIEIPESPSALQSSGQSNSTGAEGPRSASLLASPVVKTRNSSTTSADVASPAGSDVVTTVFEEFVQTIPRDLLNNWSPNQVDER